MPAEPPATPPQPPPSAPEPRRLTKPGSWSLEWTLPLLISALLAIIVTIYGSAAYEEMRSSSVAAATAHLRTVSGQLAELAAVSSGQRGAALRAIAADSSIRALLARRGDTARAAAILERAAMATDSTLVGMELWSADGVRLYARGDRATVGDSLVLRRAMAASLRADSLRRSPLYGAGTHVRTWTVVPAHEWGRIVGFVAERRQLANNPRTEEQIRHLTGQDVTVLFANRDGGFWSDLRGRPVDAPFVLDRSSDTFALGGDDDNRVFGARALIPGAPYTIVLTLPEEAVVRRARDFLGRMLSFGLVLLLVGAGGAWALSRHVTRPLRTVSDAAEAVAAGDYEHRVAIARRDELGRLGHTFNAMATRIGASRDELELRAEQASELATELAQRNDELGAAQQETLRAVQRIERLQSVTAALAGALDFE
ncbi:MAG TPA: HAMP domain-containing protein, partial [Gemmatimonadaceae bacterium]|nr:HAMP domain-containing protein [Gemmatimonadaceae bacterium]